MTKVVLSNTAKNKRKSTNLYTAYEKYRRYLRQLSKSIADTDIIFNNPGCWHINIVLSYKIFGAY